ncbi:class I SAM-dependent methyltransferase [Chryseolinea soli]|uniref:Class I SAM-dependent methyltransferase n=1 Tax=Chryseolinea soli TaxID=2321403 RepID=A0A385SJI0_9BACT|nr:class I SAM-dependent methyltransferase [Chryseolinea soli]AYB31062.1 class I SAM-dependent methyltransferase [Chryseolinea soli]
MEQQSLKGFDVLAPVYDRFASLVYGSAIRKAPLFFLKAIPSSADVLILGGGTGWLLAELLNRHPESKVWYIEASAKMIEQAQQKLSERQKSQVKFIHGTEDSIPGEVQFHAVITAFYLDLFPSAKLQRVIDKIDASLTPEGVWLVSDFIARKVWWQRILLNVMYTFFRWCCGIEAKQLPPWEQQMTAQGWEAKEEQLFFGSFMKSVRYSRRGKER